MNNAQKENNDATKAISPIVYATASFDDPPNATLTNNEIDPII